MDTGKETAGTGSSLRSTGHVNSGHKSRLFSFIFGREETKDRTLSLYNALNGTDYTNPDDITLTTIEDVIYMGMKNDLSYIVSDRASIYQTLNVNEHQSTWNPNIPVREFMYSARLYDKYLKMNHRNPYSSSLIPLPIPKLVVLYNGRIQKPDDTVLRLSDAFREGIRQGIMSESPDADIKDNKELEGKVDELLEKAGPDIEVRVRMVNINYGHNEKILSACEPLREYAWLIDRIRSNVSNGMELEMSADKALSDMPDSFELKDQLLAHKAEVIGMWINEYNEEETMQMFKEEGRKEGRKEGRREGRQEGRQEGENLITALITKLSLAGKNEDIIKMANDPAFRESLIIQYGLKKS